MNMQFRFFGYTFDFTFQFWSNRTMYRIKASWPDGTEGYFGLEQMYLRIQNAPRHRMLLWVPKDELDLARPFHRKEALKRIKLLRQLLSYDEDIKIELEEYHGFVTN